MDIIFCPLALDRRAMPAGAQDIDQIGDRDAKPAGDTLLIEPHRRGSPLILHALVSFLPHALWRDAQKIGGSAVVIGVGDHKLTEDLSLFRHL